MIFGYHTVLARYYSQSESVFCTWVRDLLFRLTEMMIQDLLHAFVIKKKPAPEIYLTGAGMPDVISENTWRLRALQTQSWKLIVTISQSRPLHAKFAPERRFS